MRAAAAVARGRRVAANVKLALVVPGSGLVKAQAELGLKVVAEPGERFGIARTEAHAGGVEQVDKGRRQQEDAQERDEKKGGDCYGCCKQRIMECQKEKICIS